MVEVSYHGKGRFAIRSNIVGFQINYNGYLPSFREKVAKAVGSEVQDITVSLYDIDS